MEKKLPSAYRLTPTVARALSNSWPIVALESTVITHGLPYPQNLALAQQMEQRVREKEAVPATIALVDGRIHIGTETNDLELLARSDRDRMHKISARDMGPAVAKLWSGGTTVAATLIAAHTAGIKVFATGGIGGVHRPLGGTLRQPGGSHSHPPLDVSADLPQLARNPVVVVCAGAKAILDLPATLEYLETVSVPVVSYRTDDFPAFYSRKSGLKAPLRADTAAEIADIARHHWQLGLESAVLVVNPPPETSALPPKQVAEAVRRALQDAAEQKIRGPKVTPYLLERVSELTHGESLQANLDLLLNNASLAAEIARELAREQWVV